MKERVKAQWDDTALKKKEYLTRKGRCRYFHRFVEQLVAAQSTARKNTTDHDHFLLHNTMLYQPALTL